MRTSSGPNRPSGLRIGGRPTGEFESRRTNGGSGNLAAVVDKAPLVGHPSPPGKGKGKISEIKYPGGSEYLRVVVRYADAVGPSRVMPLYEKPSVPTIGPLLAFESAALTFSPPTSTTVFVFLFIPLSRTSYSSSTFVHPNFLLISRVLWLAFWSFLGTRASAFLA